MDYNKVKNNIYNAKKTLNLLDKVDDPIQQYIIIQDSIRDLESALEAMDIKLSDINNYKTLKDVKCTV